MLKTKHRLAVLACGLVSAASAPALATTLIELSFEDLVAESATVVVGEATDTRVEQTANGVETITTFSVDETIVGGAAGSIEVAVPGGIYKPGDVWIREWSADAPVFPIGAEAMLFLNADGAIVGFNQGALRVVERASGKVVRLPGSAGPESVDAAAGRVRAEKARADGKARGHDKVD